MLSPKWYLWPHSFLWTPDLHIQLPTWHLQWDHLIDCKTENDWNRTLHFTPPKISSSSTSCFPDSSVGKESACNAGDTGSIPRLGRSSGVGIGYPLQYSCASLVAQLVKYPPVMWETWVRSLGWEDPLEEGMGTHSTIQKESGLLPLYLE